MKKIEKKIKFKLKKGDKVMVISGNHKDKVGEISSILVSKGRAVVSGTATLKKHVKPSEKFVSGGIIEKESSINISNLMLIDPNSGKPTRVGRKKDESGILQRYAKVSGKFI